ncbi:hypothetical protein QBC39DRAFT_405861 [Podospora conica]|nr:hypothetical protein QBC39DRAFT_405861 [Schizothecium conicum]
MSSSFDLAGKTQDTSPSLNMNFATDPRIGQMATAARKSYGVLSTKPAWEQIEGTIFRDPFKYVVPNNTSDSTSDEPPSSAVYPSTTLLERNKIPSPAKPPLAGVAAARRKARYPSSYGRKAGNSLKRGAARPILSEEEGRAVVRRPSWGRRAAAAAFAVGRRLKERGGSVRRGQAGAGEVCGGAVEGGGEPLRRETQQQGSEEWDVFVARPRGGLQHPRPSRPVNMHVFADETLERERLGGLGV